MSPSVYRDGNEGLRERLLDLEDQVALRRERLLPAFWRNVPRAIAERLEALAPVPVGEGSSQDDLARAVAVLEEYREALDAAIASVPDVEASAMTVPGEVSMPSLAGPLLGALPLLEPIIGPEASAPTLAEALTIGEQRATGRRFEGVLLTKDSGITSARFTCAGAPFAIAAVTAFRTKNGVTAASVAIATTVPVGGPRLLLRGETWGDEILKWAHLRKEIEVGDTSFDTMFLVQGDEDARELLSPPVRAALLRIAHEDVPRLVVEHGEARLDWRWDPQISMIDAAIDVLLAIREAREPLRMLKQPE